MIPGRSKAAGTASLVLLSSFLAACGADSDFRRASYLESSGRYPSAVEAYRRFTERHPRDPRVPEALVLAAEIYSRVFVRCGEARPLFERAARESGGTGPWADRARRGLFNCPDYFPLTDGARRVYGDSQTGGRNMRLELEVSASTDGARGRIDGEYYAGKRRFREYHRTYEKKDWILWEGSGKNRTELLRYPFDPGRTWRTRKDGAAMEFLIESDSATLELPTGVVSGCLKIRETPVGKGSSRSWTYEYFAPGMGRVRTSVAGTGFETPITDLLH